MMIKTEMYYFIPHHKDHFEILFSLMSKASQRLENINLEKTVQIIPPSRVKHMKPKKFDFIKPQMTL